MKLTAVVTSIVGITTLALLSYRVTHSFFSDPANSTTNTFVASANFPASTPTPTPVGIANHVVISEVQTTGGVGGGQDQLTDRDFIELYNPTPVDLNLNGMRLVKRTGSGVPTDDNIFTFTSLHIIGAHGFFLWASTGSPGFAASIGADVTSSDSLAISNNSIALRQGDLDTGTIVDALSWASVSGSLTEGTRFTPDLNANQSMERKALTTSTAGSMAVSGTDEFKGNGFDLNDNATDFVLRAVSQPQNSGSAIETP